MRRIAIALTIVLGASGCTGIPGDRTAEQALADFIEAANSGDIEGALEIMADDAIWAQDEFEFPLGEPLGQEFGWLAAGLGLDDGATFESVISAFLTAQFDIQTHRTVTACRGDDSSVSCDYQAGDALSAISSSAETGVLMVQASNDSITRWDLHADPPGEPALAWDHFRRWARIESPQFDIGDLPLVDADGLLELINEWDAAARPDVARPSISEDPIAVIEALLAAHTAADWESWVGLLGGEALDAGLGTWDDFQATNLLERVIAPTECEVTLESERLGAAVACQVVVSDIILDTAQIEGTQWNATTFHVKDGRVTTLPVFVPSSAVAERRIEEWAIAEHPAEYAGACPDGIVDPAGVESLPCAEFIVRYRAEWSPLVAAVLSDR